MTPGVGKHPDHKDHQRGQHRDAQHRVDRPAEKAEGTGDDLTQQHRQGNGSRGGKNGVHKLFAVHLSIRLWPVCNALEG